MSHNLNFGSYRVGDAFVKSPLVTNGRYVDPHTIYELGPFDATLEPGDYAVQRRHPHDDLLVTKPGHVYAYRGKMYVFLSNAMEDTEPLDDSLRSTLQHLPVTIRSANRSGGREVDLRQRFIGKPKNLEDDAGTIGIDLHTSNPFDACAKTETVTRSRALFFLNEEESPSGRAECIQARTQSYVEPQPSMQMREKTLKGIHYCQRGGTIFEGNSNSRRSPIRTYGNRVVSGQGLLGNVFQDGPEFGGFVRLNDLRRGIGALMLGYLTRSIPRKAKKKMTHFAVSPAKNGVDAHQRIDNVELNRVFVVYSNACKSFVVICSVVVTFTDILIDTRDQPAIPYLYGCDSRQIPFYTNVPCLRAMDATSLLHDAQVRKRVKRLFRSVSGQILGEETPIVDEVLLHSPTFFADRWRLIGMIAIMFAHEAKTLGLQRTLFLWFDQEFDRILFESTIASVEEQFGSISYLDDYVQLRLTGTPFLHTSNTLTFDNMLTCVDQLIATRETTYRSRLCQDLQVTDAPHFPPGLFNFDSCEEEVDTSLSLELSQNDEHGPKNVWLFINSEIDLSAICTNEATQLLRLSTQQSQSMVR